MELLPLVSWSDAASAAAAAAATASWDLELVLVVEVGKSDCLLRSEELPKEHPSSP